MGKYFLLSAVFLVFINCCFDCMASSMEWPQYTNTMTDEELVREYEKSFLGLNPIKKKYIYDVLYVGMPEEEFVKKFTKDSSYEETARPCIFKKEGNAYYVTFPNYPYLKGKYMMRRITFKNGNLTKCEYRYLDKPPFMWYVYHDETGDLSGKW